MHIVIFLAAFALCWVVWGPKMLLNVIAGIALVCAILYGAAFGYAVHLQDKEETERVATAKDCEHQRLTQKEVAPWCDWDTSSK